MEFEDILAYLLSKNYTDEIAMEQQADTELAIRKANEYTDSVASKIEWKKEITDTLPDPSVADPHTMYFVPATVTPEKDGYIEYMFLQDKGKYEVIGRTTAEYIIDEETLSLENNILKIKVIPNEGIANLFTN